MGLIKLADNSWAYLRGELSSISIMPWTTITADSKQNNVVVFFKNSDMSCKFPPLKNIIYFFVCFQSWQCTQSVLSPDHMKCKVQNNDSTAVRLLIGVQLYLFFKIIEFSELSIQTLEWFFSSAKPCNSSELSKYQTTFCHFVCQHILPLI